MSHYTHLTIEERESILRMLVEGKKIQEIAKVLDRSPSTVSRELHRNCKRREDYSPAKAEKAYRKRREKSGRQRLFSVNPAAKEEIRTLFLDLHWSPEQIANRLRLENSSIQVSYATIYRGIYSHDLEVQPLARGSRGMARKLRHSGKRRHRRGEEERRGKIPISHPLEERPDTANNRSEIGHWEVDTVAGKKGGSCLITSVDRKSRFTLGKRAARKAAQEVEDGMVTMLMQLPPEARRSLTPDRGKEFATHASVTIRTGGTPFYFPRPHAPWERGTNENTNGLLREFLPKGVDMNSFSDEQIEGFIDLLNKRPRKCLGWKTPFEVFFDISLQLT